MPHTIRETLSYLVSRFDNEIRLNLIGENSVWLTFVWNRHTNGYKIWKNLMINGILLRCVITGHENIAMLSYMSLHSSFCVDVLLLPWRTLNIG